MCWRDSNLNYGAVKVRSPGFEPGIASLEGLCPKPARRRPLRVFPYLVLDLTLSAGRTETSGWGMRAETLIMA